MWQSKISQGRELKLVARHALPHMKNAVTISCMQYSQGNNGNFPERESFVREDKVCNRFARVTCKTTETECYNLAGSLWNKLMTLHQQMIQHHIGLTLYSDETCSST